MAPVFPDESDLASFKIDCCSAVVGWAKIKTFQKKFMASSSLAAENFLSSKFHFLFSSAGLPIVAFFAWNSILIFQNANSCCCSRSQRPIDATRWSEREKKLWIWWNHRGGNRLLLLCRKRFVSPRIFVRFAENSQQYQLNYDSTSRKTPNSKQKSQNSGKSSHKTFLSGIAFRLLLPRKTR